MSLDDRGNSIVRPFGQRLRLGFIVHEPLQLNQETIIPSPPIQYGKDTYSMIYAAYNMLILGHESLIFEVNILHKRYHCNI